jgi:fibronectin-binding autotransporter adhesin
MNGIPPFFWRSLWVCAAAAAAALPATPAHAQRQMEKLGRGVVALRTSSTQVYVGWRLLGTDPDSIGFNLYRIANGGAPLKLNSQPLTNTTDYVDTTANLTLSNAWFVRPVTNGVEQTASGAWIVPANAPARQYFSVPLRPVTGGAYPPYDVKFCWVGDLDGDGEYDFVVDRLSTTGGVNQYLQAYLRNGTFLWQMDMGYKSTNQYNIEPGSAAISTGDKDNVTVYDLDGDGRAEVIVRVARGTVLADGTVVTGPDDTTQYLSVLDGLTGKERARATIPNPFLSDGPLNSHLGILYCDGVHPSVVLEGDNRVGSGPFNYITMAWDFKNGQLTQRWQWIPPGTGNYARGHQIRIADVNHDGIDDIVEIGSVNNGFDGQPLFDTELGHGDRLHISDMDPDRPGLETYAIQQNNPTLLATALYDSATGKFIKKWYSSGIVDVGRGIAIDIDPNHKGYELYSTQPGIFDCKGNQIFANSIWPLEGLWWDADLSRELIDGAGSGALSPVVNKFDPGTGTAGRLYTIYNDNGGVHQAYGGRSAFWGDIFGDWREELVLVANDYSEIRIYISTIPATNRLYCLMQNPAYRCQATLKGYYEANYPDYYLGTDMQPPPPPPNSDAKLVWRGGGANSWDAGSTANWFTNNLWISNTVPVAFSAGDTVLFDLTGSNSTPVNLIGTLTPGAVTVYSPIDYVFGGGGSLAGQMKLTKVGGGKLTLTGTNTFTGSTTLWEGPLIVTGSLSASPVVVRSGAWLDAAIGGVGFVGGGVTVYRGGSLAPGAGASSPGTLTISNGLVEINGAFNRFHLSDDPSGTVKTNDLLKVIGNLTLTGTNTVYVTPLNTNLAAGVYPLIDYSGALAGGLSNLVVNGLPGIPVALTNPPGQIALVVKSYRPPAAVTWVGGGAGNAWDLLTTSNWLNGAVRDQFVPLDSVRFDNTAATNTTVTLVGSLNAAAIVVDTTSNYTWTGSGAIIGSATLTKSNAGTLTISASANSFTGRTWIAGGMLVVSELDPVGFPSPLGNPGANPSNLVMSGSSTLRVTGESYTDRGLTLNAGTNSLEVFNAADQVTIAGQLVGSGALQKLGSGTLALTVSNNYSGGTLIKNGHIALGSVAGNQYGVGAGTVTLDGGALDMLNVQASESCPWALLVPSGSIGSLTVDGRCSLTGPLTGGGTLNISTPYVRTDFNGNWSAFTGQISVTTASGGANFRCNNSAGCPSARFSLGNLVSLHNRVGGTPTIPIGELSGVTGSTISAPGGNDGLAVNWRVGGLNTTATFAGNTYNGVGFIKEGTGTWIWTGTNTHTGQTTINNGTLLVRGDASAAIGAVTVAAAGTLVVNGSLGTNTVTVYGTLAGKGAVGGRVVVQPGGILSPGTGLGILTISNTLTLMPGSTVLMELSKSPVTNDLVRVTGALAYGGTLVVTNLSTPALVAGDCFQLFSAGSYNGAFACNNLPVLNAGLIWNTSRLAVDGTLWVVSTVPPRFGSPVVSGTNLNLSVSGGTPGWPCYLLASTNVAQPMTQWARIATNQFDDSGNSTFILPINPAFLERFYRLQVP